MTELTPLLVFTILMGGWSTSPYSVLLAEEHLFAFAFLSAALFGRIASNVILAHLTKGAFPDGLAYFTPLAVVSLATNVPAFGGCADTQANALTRQADPALARRGTVRPLRTDALVHGQLRLDGARHDHDHLRSAAYPRVLDPSRLCTN